MKSLNLKYKHWKITKFKVAILVFYLLFYRKFRISLI